MNFNLASLSRDGRPSRDGSPPFLAPQMLVNAASTGLLVRLRLLLTIKSTQDVLSWLPEGKIWRIHMVQTFVASLLPVFSADVSSWNQFLVSLSELGFRVVSRGPDSIAFFHEGFLRDCDNSGVTSLNGPSRGGPLSPTSVLPNVGPGLNISFPRSLNEVLQGPSRLNMQIRSSHPSPSPSSINGSLSLIDLLRLTGTQMGTQQVSYGQKREPQDDASLSTESDSGRSNRSSNSNKKAKKKWLPPLGPPEAESAIILRKRKAVGFSDHASPITYSKKARLHFA